MYKIIIKIAVLCIMLFALLLTVNSCKESDSIFKDNETQEPVTRSGESGWDYPVKPGTGAWNAFKDRR